MNQKRRAFPDRAEKNVPEPRDSDGLRNGHWVTRGGIRVFVPEPVTRRRRSTGRPVGRPRIDEPTDWTDAELLAAHAAHRSGARDPHIVEGNRIYKRNAQRAYRATQKAQEAACDGCGGQLDSTTCETCITWAEKDARLHAERQQSRANRHVIWDILNTRKAAA